MSKNDELCIKNEELCIKNEELCIKNEELCRMMTVANDIWSVIETSVSVFFVTQIDDWVHYCLMSHPHMQAFKQLLSTRTAPGKPTKIMTKHLAIGFDDSGIVPAEEVHRTLMVRGIGVAVPVASVFTHVASVFTQDDASSKIVWPSRRENSKYGL